LCKIGNKKDMTVHGKISGFNFKKCNATKFIYGSRMYKYTYPHNDYDKKLVEERNI
jgi:hypothetical protein